MANTILTVITIAIISLFFNSQAISESAEDIEILEEEKSKLHKQINKAIAESVKSLQNSNDTNLVKLMAELRDRFDIAKGNSSTDLEIDKLKLNNTDGRRSRHKNKKEKVPRIIDGRRNRHKIKLTLEELQKLLKPTGVKFVPPTENAKNHDAMKLTIDQWLEQQRLKKLKVKEYRHKAKLALFAGDKEKCPRFGQGKKMIKINGKRRPRYYPCCRKCCKKSYMGCL